ncbi:MAG: 3,4-dihydroxy-2-butanone-4-phosphate synthase [Methanocellales archaeon]|nr:3,4-dihydroxy-2-butanone-4-phosphate synthase [Methanocellales archaeon]
MIYRATESIKKGNMVLIYDSDDREGETDIIMPAHAVTPKHVALMRRDAGGLICVAIHPLAAQRLGLPFMSDLLKHANELAEVVEKPGDIPYDISSSFSLWVNHRNTFTGITDIDRALTINEISKAVQSSLNGAPVDFGKEFRSPGHVPLLRAAGNLLNERKGQTELSIALAELANITPAMVMCEMLDENTGKALSKRDAKLYAKNHDLVFLEGSEIVEAYENFLEFRSLSRRTDG